MSNKNSNTIKYDTFSRPWLRWVPNQKKYYIIYAVLAALLAVLCGIDYGQRAALVGILGFSIIYARDFIVFMSLDMKTGDDRAWWEQNPELLRKNRNKMTKSDSGAVKEDNENGN